MIIGEINENDIRVKFEMNLNCTNCGKKVPGGLQSSEKFYGTESFKNELKQFKENYLCGICRDKKRTRVK